MHCGSSWINEKAFGIISTEEDHEDHMIMVAQPFVVRLVRSGWSGLVLVGPGGSGWVLNCRTHLICLSYTDSDNAFFQQEIATTNVSTFQLLLYSKLVGFGLLVELLTNGAELPADFLADARDCAIDAFEVPSFLHRANLVSCFAVRRLRNYSSSSITYLVVTSRFAPLAFREHPFFPTFPLFTFR